MSSTSSPTYSEIYDEVLEKLYATINTVVTVEDLHSATRSFMDALYEAYDLGALHATEAIAANLNRTPHAARPNPYGKYNETI
jgi:hypothetical protein